MMYGMNSAIRPFFNAAMLSSTLLNMSFMAAPFATASSPMTRPRSCASLRMDFISSADAFSIGVI